MTRSTAFEDARDAWETASADPYEPHPDDPGPDDPDEQYEQALSDEEAIQRELTKLRRHQIAQQRLAAENAPPFRWLNHSEFLAAPTPEQMVLGLFYRDSLARMYGPGGGGKSLVMLDIAYRVALDLEWSASAITGGPVMFIMAEGQRVNTARGNAWLDYHGATDPDSLATLHDRFIVVPDAVLLTEEAAQPFLRLVAHVKPALIVLDTKNATMAGEENSATDFAALRRVMDLCRALSGGACVVLVDHTGHDGLRPRGSSAGSAAMDTEIRVTQGADRIVDVLVTRDKADEDGFRRTFRITRHNEQPVIVPTAATGEPDRATPVPPEDVPVPADVLHFDGPGAKLVPTLARLMAVEANPSDADPGRIGLSRAEATTALRAAQVISNDDTSLRRAWSALHELGAITPADGVRAKTGRCVWSRP